jgi:signal transduction histidine kinase
VRRRLVRVILSVTVFTLVLLGVPLAVVARRSYEDRSTVELQRRAAVAALEVSIAGGEIEIDPDLEEDGRFSVYDDTGARVSGDGPPAADAAVRAALAGSPTFDHSTEDLVYAAPIVMRGSDEVGAVVRVAQPDSVVDSEVHRAWLVMAAVGAGALLIAAAVAAALARRLAKPVQRLATDAAHLGAGGVVLAPEPTGVPELDLLGDAMATSSARIAEVLARERAFSADVSHQLRTPLTGLRLILEREHSEVTVRALAEVDRLQATIEQLLALSRDHRSIDAALDVRAAVGDAQTRWTGRVAATGRTLRTTVDERVPEVYATRAAVDQIIDVLIDNALIHGAGDVHLGARSTPGGAAIDVGDDGPGVALADSEAIFRRGHGSGHGIGLALARSLSEADGGRLVLAANTPPRFSLILPVADDHRPARAAEPLVAHRDRGPGG